MVPCVKSADAPAPVPVRAVGPAAIAAAGLLPGARRRAVRNPVGPIVGHLPADLAR